MERVISACRKCSLLRGRPALWLLTGILFVHGCSSNQDEFRPVEPEPTGTEESLPETSDDSFNVKEDDAPARPFPSEDSADSPGSAEPDPSPKPVPESDTQEPTTSTSETSMSAPQDARASTSLQSSGLNLTTPVNDGPREIKLLVPHKEFTREDGAIRITFDDIDLLKVCNMDPVPPNVMEYLPDWLKNLNGQKIVLRGWMFPSGRQDGISSFMFVRDNGICCFGRDPKVYDKLGVTMQSGLTTSYIAGRPFDVVGTLIIEPDIEGPDEGLWWLYRIEDARVIDKG